MHAIAPRRSKDARKQAGDTIVEVMIVLAVLGMAIGISYSTANRSLLNARQAQESSLATEIVQAQVESLKAMASDSDIYTTTPAFCVTNDGSTLGVSPLTDDQKSAPLGDSFPASCKMGEANRYSIVITQPSTGTFSVKAYWDDVEGQGTDTATMNYSMPEVQPVVGGAEDEGGEGGGGGGGGATVPPTLGVINKHCGVAVTTGLGVGSQNNNADLVVTGTPSTTVTIHTAMEYTWFLGPLTDTYDYSVTLDPSGNGTQHVTYNGYINLTSWVATARDSSGNSTASVQVCP